MEIPTARILEDGVIRIGYAQASPYRWYAGGMGVLPGLEFSGRITELTNVESGLGSAYGNYKDKAFDLKYQLLPESKLLPAIAVGIHDFHGTKLYPAEYLVLSRQFFPFDFTVGLGRKRLKGDVEFPLWDELGLFGGIECAITKKLHLLVEYNPIEYGKDVKPKAVSEGAESPINIGIRMKILPGLDLGVSWQRGDTLGLMCHLQFKLGKQITPKRPDPPLWYSVDRRPFKERDSKEMLRKIQNVIYNIGFNDVSVYTDNKILIAEFENGKYLSNQKAAGRALRVLLYHSPPDIKELSIILKRRQIPFLKISVKPDHLDKYLHGKIPEDIFCKLVKVEIWKDTIDDRQDFIKTKEAGRFHYDFGIKPELETYLNDPSGVFKARLGIMPYLTSTLWKGGAAYARYDIPFYSDISSSNIPPPDAVRSDSWQYQDTDYSFDRLIFDQAFRLSDKTFGRLSSGYFEKMYAGASGEILTFFGDGKLALGIEGDWTKKRKPGTQFDLMSFESHTILGNAYYFLPGIDVTLHAQYGRFMAGDVGWRFEASREYGSGVTIGCWCSFTDTDDLTGFNKGYHDKGVFLNLPARMFSNYETNTKYHYSLSPWTRDVAAKVSHWQNLYNLSSDLMPGHFIGDLDKIKE